jgi:hypothetical protein
MQFMTFIASRKKTNWNLNCIYFNKMHIS